MLNIRFQPCVGDTLDNSGITRLKMGTGGVCSTAASTPAAAKASMIGAVTVAACLPTTLNSTITSPPLSRWIDPTFERRLMRKPLKWLTKA